MDNLAKRLTEWIAIAFVIIAFVAMLGGLFLTCKDKQDVNSTPVEDSVIDSISIFNEKLIIEVESLDSIKNVKEIEVKALDNDSTLKLFYELIRK